MRSKKPPPPFRVGSLIRRRGRKTVRVVERVYPKGHILHGMVRINEPISGMRNWLYEEIEVVRY